jgi:hypothetical protein
MLQNQRSWKSRRLIILESFDIKNKMREEPINRSGVPSCPENGAIMRQQTVI